MIVMHGSEDDCCRKMEADQWYRDHENDDDDDDDDDDFIIESIMLKGQNLKTDYDRAFKF